MPVCLKIPSLRILWNFSYWSDVTFSFLEHQLLKQQTCILGTMWLTLTLRETVWILSVCCLWKTNKTAPRNPKTTSITQKTWQVDITRSEHWAKGDNISEVLVFVLEEKWMLTKPDSVSPSSCLLILLTPVHGIQNLLGYRCTFCYRV